MLGRRPEAQLELFCYLPEVPPTRLAQRLAEVQEAFDWEAVRARAEAYFAPRVGRPSLDPAVVVKLLLLHKLVGGRSWRSLVEFASDSLACRRFLGYELHEVLPSHQALSDWRARLGADFFEDLVTDVVLHCVREGMVLSEVRVVDATGVKAQADRRGPVVEMSAEVSEVEAWLAAAGVGEDDDEPPPRAALREVGHQSAAPDAAKAATRVVNRHDPEARLSRKPGQPTAFRYQVSFCSDPYSQLIVSTTAKGTEEPQTMVEHVDRDPGRVAFMVGDKHYDSTAVMVALVARGVQAVVPRQERRQHGFRQEQFHYDAQGDAYWCLGGERLGRSGVGADGKRSYRAPAGACPACRLRAWCTTSQRRSVSRQAGAEARERTLRSGPLYRELMARRRQQEHLWRLAKRDFGMARADGPGVAGMRLSAALVAVCINLGKLRAWRTRPRVDGTAGAVAPSAQRGLPRRQGSLRGAWAGRCGPPPRADRRPTARRAGSTPR